MPKSDDHRTEALSRLDDELKAFESKRAGTASPQGDARAASEAYRLMAGLIGGLLGGIGFGWLFDQFAHTGPWGMIGGLLIGIAAATYGAVRKAGQMNVSTPTAKVEPVAPAPVDDEDD